MASIPILLTNGALIIDTEIEFDKKIGGCHQRINNRYISAVNREKKASKLPQAIHGSNKFLIFLNASVGKNQEQEH